MKRSIAVRLGLAAFSVLSMLSLPVAVAAQGEEDEGFQNLHVLPPDVPRRQLFDAMLSNLAGLDLRRRQNEGCLFCHMGDMDVPRGEWDYASDEKPTKRKAREMMAMVKDINARLAGLEARVAPSLEVTCYTCHAGRTDPRPLPDLLRAAYEEGGIEGAIERYRELRSRYFGGDAYDFRIGVLPRFANGLARQGAFDDALALSALNEEAFPDGPQARRITLSFLLQRALAQDGVDGVEAEFDRLRAAEPSNIVTWGALDGLGWGLFRTERQDDALQLFRKNFTDFPGEYVPMESLADAQRLSGDLEAAIAMFEEWTAANPDHDMSRRRLLNLRERRP